MAERPRNIYMDLFSEAFLADQQARGITDPAPYLIQTKDGVQLAALIRKGEECSWPITVERWEKGLAHYFQSELGERTIADLAARFSTFWKGSLDRYNKPKEKASQVGNGGTQEGLLTAQSITGSKFASWHQGFVLAAWKIAQRDEASLDAIDALFDELRDLDEVSAFRKLKAIEHGATVKTEAGG